MWWTRKKLLLSSFALSILLSAIPSSAAPVITPPLVPSSGITGTLVTINGSGFGGSKGSSTVKFNGVVATTTTWTDTQVKATVPATATTGNVVVTVLGIASNGVLFTVLPHITSLVPTSAKTGVTVSINGTGFGTSQGSSTVTFNGVTATTINSWSTQLVKVNVPANATTGPVVVTVGSNPSNGQPFTVLPNISGLSETQGIILDPVTISGTGFGTSQGTVTFGGIGASISSWSNTSIVAIVPSTLLPGPRSVVVTVGGHASNGVNFTLLPSITSISPTQGRYGSSVTIVGGGFGTTQNQFSGLVTLNGTAMNIISTWNTNQIVAQLDTSHTWTTGPIQVSVTVNSIVYQSNTKTFTLLPDLLFVIPSSGIIGTAIDLEGQNFGNTQGTVTFNGVGATITSWSNFDVRTSVPSGAMTGPIIVTDSLGNASNQVNFVVPPNITNASPGSAITGTPITISGTAFGSSQGLSTITFNGVTANPTSWNYTTIVAPVPASALSGPIVVTVGGTPSNNWSFTVIPNITSLSPTSGGINAFVTVSGSAFGTSQGSNTITFNGTISNPASWTNTSVVAPVPSTGSSGPVVVTVGGNPSNSLPFTYMTTGTVTGTVTRASDQAPVNGAVVELLQGGLQKAYTTTAVNGSYSIANLTPGSYDLRVTATGYEIATLPGNLVNAGPTTLNVVVGAPTISSLTPNAGPIGTAVTISGSYFGSTQGTSTVTFNPNIQATITSWSNTSLSTSVPSGATTGPVVVTVAGIPSAGSTFTVGTGGMTGTITRVSDGSPVSGATVQALQNNVVKGSATTAANGTYTISNLSPGTFDVKVSASGLGSTIQTGKNVTVGSPIVVNVALPAAGTDHGTVFKSDGITPISGATVTAFVGVDSAGSATSDGSGNFTIAALAPGTYSVQASATGYSTQTRTGVVIVANQQTITNFQLPAQSVITYSYDELGRLSGTVDSQADAVGYRYDAVGNITSIARNPSTQVSISGFVPVYGPIGTSVTINGTGFSTNPSQDTVAFNGTNATITSATATQIIATVPNGATSGTIHVTAPNGSATSASAFTVTVLNPPTISGFSPGIISLSDTVAITGTNFDTNSVNDTVNFNTTFGSISAVTPTSISASVPVGAPSGHIAVTTLAGRAVSSGDLYVAPPPYHATDVDYTGRLARIMPPPSSSSTNITVNTANHIAMLIVDGQVGDRLAVAWSNVVGFDGCSLFLNGIVVYVLGPDGTQLGLDNCTGSFDTLILTENGVYTIIIAPQDGKTGSATFTLYEVPPDVTGTVSPSNPTLPFVQSVGQNVIATFFGTANQVASVAFAGGPDYHCGISGGNYQGSLRSPTGSYLYGPTCGNINPTTLPVTGTYTIEFDPLQLTTGNGTVTLSLQ